MEYINRVILLPFKNLDKIQARLRHVVQTSVADNITQRSFEKKVREEQMKLDELEEHGQCCICHQQGESIEGRRKKDGGMTLLEGKDAVIVSAALGVSLRGYLCPTCEVIRNKIKTRLQAQELKMQQQQQLLQEAALIAGNDASVAASGTLGGNASSVQAEQEQQNNILQFQQQHLIPGDGREEEQLQQLASRSSFFNDIKVAPFVPGQRGLASGPLSKELFRGVTAWPTDHPLDIRIIAPPISKYLVSSRTNQNNTGKDGTNNKHSSQNGQNLQVQSTDRVALTFAIRPVPDKRKQKIDPYASFAGLNKTSNNKNNNSGYFNFVRGGRNNNNNNNNVDDDEDDNDYGDELYSTTSSSSSSSSDVDDDEGSIVEVIVGEDGQIASNILSPTPSTATTNHAAKSKKKKRKEIPKIRPFDDLQSNQQQQQLQNINSNNVNKDSENKNNKDQHQHHQHKPQNLYFRLSRIDTRKHAFSGKEKQQQQRKEQRGEEGRQENSDSEDEEQDPIHQNVSADGNIIVYTSKTFKIEELERELQKLHEHHVSFAVTSLADKLSSPHYHKLDSNTNTVKKHEDATKNVIYTHNNYQKFLNRDALENPQKTWQTTPPLLLSSLVGKDLTGTFLVEIFEQREVDTAIATTALTPTNSVSSPAAAASAIASPKNSKRKEIKIGTCSFRLDDLKSATIREEGPLEIISAKNSSKVVGQLFLKRVVVHRYILSIEDTDENETHHHRRVRFADGADSQNNQNKKKGKHHQRSNRKNLLEEENEIEFDYHDVVPTFSGLHQQEFLPHWAVDALLARKCDICRTRNVTLFHKKYKELLCVVCKASRRHQRECLPISHSSPMPNHRTCLSLMMIVGKARPLSRADPNYRQDLSLFPDQPNLFLQQHQLLELVEKQARKNKANQEVNEMVFAASNNNSASGSDSDNNISSTPDLFKYSHPNGKPTPILFSEAEGLLGENTTTNSSSGAPSSTVGTRRLKTATLFEGRKIRLPTSSRKHHIKSSDSDTNNDDDDDESSSDSENGEQQEGKKKESTESSSSSSSSEEQQQEDLFAECWEATPKPLPPKNLLEREQLLEEIHAYYSPFSRRQKNSTNNTSFKMPKSQQQEQQQQQQKQSPKMNDGLDDEAFLSSSISQPNSPKLKLHEEVPAAAPPQRATSRQTTTTTTTLSSASLKLNINSNTNLPSSGNSAERLDEQPALAATGMVSATTVGTVTPTGSQTALFPNANPNAKELPIQPPQQVQQEKVMNTPQNTSIQQQQNSSPQQSNLSRRNSYNSGNNNTATTGSIFNQYSIEQHILQYQFQQQQNAQSFNNSRFSDNASVASVGIMTAQVSESGRETPCTPPPSPIGSSGTTHTTTTGTAQLVTPSSVVVAQTTNTGGGGGVANNAQGRKRFFPSELTNANLQQLVATAGSVVPHNEHYAASTVSNTTVNTVFNNSVNNANNNNYYNNSNNSVSQQQQSQGMGSPQPSSSAQQQQQQQINSNNNEFSKQQQQQLYGSPGSASTSFRNPNTASFSSQPAAGQWGHILLSQQQHQQYNAAMTLSPESSRATSVVSVALAPPSSQHLQQLYQQELKRQRQQYQQQQYQQQQQQQQQQASQKESNLPLSPQQPSSQPPSQHSSPQAHPPIINLNNSNSGHGQNIIIMNSTTTTHQNHPYSTGNNTREGSIGNTNNSTTSNSNSASRASPIATHNNSTNNIGGGGGVSYIAPISLNMNLGAMGSSSSVARDRENNNINNMNNNNNNNSGNVSGATSVIGGGNFQSVPNYAGDVHSSNKSTTGNSPDDVLSPAFPPAATVGSMLSNGGSTGSLNAGASPTITTMTTTNVIINTQQQQGESSVKRNRKNDGDRNKDGGDDSQPRTNTN